MSQTIVGKKVAILATNGFEQSELLKPKAALEEAGAKTFVVAPKAGGIKGWDKNDWGADVAVDIVLHDAITGDFDALVLPGGVLNPDQLRIIPEAVDFVKSFVEAGKPVAAICHGPWMLVEADVVRGKIVTSWRSLKTDIVNAGGHWVDQEVVESGGLITSRNPNDIPAFAKALIEAIAVAKPQPHLQLTA